MLWQGSILHKLCLDLGMHCAGAGDYLAALRASKTFSSPDCTEAMAAAWGVQGALDSLQVSLLSIAQVTCYEHVPEL